MLKTVSQRSLTVLTKTLRSLEFLKSWGQILKFKSVQSRLKRPVFLGPDRTNPTLAIYFQV
uniref:Uncharacterized protein n=1 Tax=Rhizophagus irregularis (strain DAOM 181602 / DAOM 197198 / MUCL 43194) TaxID=747089 RepID=U9TB57_RHIID